MNFEKKTRNQFCAAHEIWLYEDWVKNNSGVKSVPRGFAIVSRGEAIDVMFGYVDYADVEKVIKNYYPIVDARGYSSINLLQVIKAKLFAVRVLKFNDRLIKASQTSENLMFKFMQCPELNIEANTIKKTKIVQYSIAINNKPSSLENKLLTDLQKYLVENKLDAINSGIGKYLIASEASTTLPENMFNITSIIVCEQWERGKTGKLESKIVSITPIINNTYSLEPFDYNSLNNWNNSYSQSYFRQKNFNYHIVKINNQKINDELPSDKSIIDRLKNINTWS